LFLAGAVVHGEANQYGSNQHKAHQSITVHHRAKSGKGRKDNVCE
jgi:hypothetical protein